jgi:hypothetical protein
MPSRTQITLSPEVHRKARTRAADLGVSFAEYIRRLVEKDLGEPEQTADPSVLFNLGRSAGSDIAADKDRALGEATAAQRFRPSDH